jgi:hypothetical protein
MMKRYEVYTSTQCSHEVSLIRCGNRVVIDGNDLSLIGCANRNATDGNDLSLVRPNGRPEKDAIDMLSIRQYNRESFAVVGLKRRLSA